MHARNSTAVGLLTAIVVAGMSLAPQSASADLRLNLRFTDETTVKPVAPADVGSEVTVNVWASITNIGGVNGTGSHEGFKFAAFSVLSRRLVTGPAGSVDGAITNPTLVRPFNATGSQLGLLTDLNADGITDLGSLADISTGDVARPRTPGAVYDDEPGATGQSIPNGFEFLVERFTFRIDAVPAAPLLGAGTALEVVIPTWRNGSVVGAEWWQDANPEVSIVDGLNVRIDYFAGTSVTFVPVPEPATAGLLVAGLAVLVVRRRRDWHNWQAMEMSRMAAAI